jgi:hypothetical protein
VNGSALAPQGLSPAISYWLAAGVLIVLLVVLAFVAGAARSRLSANGETAPDGSPADEATRGTGATLRTGQVQRAGSGRPRQPHPFWYVVLGADNRVSTSKTQFALWTLALAYALLVIAFHDAVYPPGSLDPRYLLLLGFPAGAAVSAKAITTGQIANGTASKDPVPFTGKTPGAALSDIVSNDQGNLDLGDAQYFLFNLVALTAFFIAFFHSPVSLPVLPDTLVGLTSASAAAYVAKKATVPASPIALTAVSPQKGAPDDPVRVFGSGLGSTAPGSGDAPYVTMGGISAPAAAAPTATVVQVKVPDLSPGTVDVQIVTPDGRTAVLPAAFEVTARPDARRPAGAEPQAGAQPPAVPQPPAGPPQ